MNELKIGSDFLPYQNSIEFAPNLHLKMGKIHEACGPAKIRIAILLAAKTRGLIVWIRLNSGNTDLNMDDISNWFSPNRLLLINVDSQSDLFFATEEILRSGISELTITEVIRIPNNVQMRRLNLSIKKGILSSGMNSNIGLILTPNKGGATNIDSRWHACSLPCWSTSTNNIYPTLRHKWHISRLFSKTEPNKGWFLEGILPNENDRNSTPKLLLTPSK